MRWIMPAFALLLATPLGPVRAQTPLTGTTGAPTAAPPATSPAEAPRAPRRTLQDRFDAANTTHDGHLTAEQARSGMPAVARNFAAIDADHKGYVTIDQIRTYQRQARAARAATKAQ